MQIVAGAGVSDTVLAKPFQALTVVVLQNGLPKPGVVVSFEGLPAQGTDPNGPGSTSGGILVSSVAANDFVGFVSDTTDLSGRASVLVQFGTRAGDMGVRITYSTLGLWIADTAQFTVRPGNSTQLIVGVRDTVLQVGASFGIGAYSADRFRNMRSQDAVTYLAIDTVATVNAAGTVQARQAVGRGTVVIRANGFEDSTHFTVVPIAELTAVYDGTDGVSRIATLKLDGSSLRVLGAIKQTAYPSHSPTEDLIAYEQEMNGGAGITLQTGTGSARVLVEAAPPWSGRYPAFSADGASIYFGGTVKYATYWGYAIWRVGVDGSGLTMVATTDAFTTPGLSSDGTRIAFSSGDGMFVQSIATGESVRVGRHGLFPSFSPDGQRIAYVDYDWGILTIAAVDGSSSRLMTQNGAYWDERVSWLPDGNWILRSRFHAPVLVNVASGEEVRLPHLARLREVTVKP